MFFHCLSYLPAVWGSPGDPLALAIGGHRVDWTIFSLLAAPLIFWSTNTGVKINRWFFYIAIVFLTSLFAVWEPASRLHQMSIVENIRAQ